MAPFFEDRRDFFFENFATEIISLSDQLHITLTLKLKEFRN